MNRSKKKGGGKFVRLPNELIDSKSFRGLSGSAVMLLIMLMKTYNGRNNGKICAIHSQLNPPWTNRHHKRLLAELREHGFIVPTQIGKFGCGGCRPTFYRLTHIHVDASLPDDDFWMIPPNGRPTFDYRKW